MDEVARRSLFLALDLILKAHGADRAEAGLAVVRALRDANVSCWSDLLPGIRKWNVPQLGFRTKPRPDGVSPYGYGYVYTIDPRQVVIDVAVRLDLIPPADLAELALLTEVASSVRAQQRAQAIRAHWERAFNDDELQRRRVGELRPAWLVRLTREAP